jgi:Flp pilus assembly protein TadG
MRRRWREESGEATTEMVLIVPVLLLLLLVVVQFGLWYHAQHVVQAAAQEGTRAARVEGATADDGSRRAELFLARSGGGVVDDPAVLADRTADQIRVEVSGRAVAVIPGLHLTVNAAATSPTEEFRPDLSAP